MIHLICGSTGAGKTTYAERLRTELGALHLSIDDWMVTLFGPDSPPQANWPWIEERLLRCERQILVTALQAARVGMPSILDLGLQRAEQRRRIAERASACNCTSSTSTPPSAGAASSSATNSRVRPSA